MYMAATTRPGIMHSSEPANVNTLISSDATSAGTKKLKPLKRSANSAFRPNSFFMQKMWNPAIIEP